MEEINVGLYGGKSIFGGKETPLEASVILCDKHNECSYYKNGHCLLVRSFGSTGCKFGRVNNIRGYPKVIENYNRRINRLTEENQKLRKENTMITNALFNKFGRYWRDEINLKSYSPKKMRNKEIFR